MSMSSIESKIERLVTADDLPQRLAAVVRLPLPLGEGRGEGAMPPDTAMQPGAWDRGEAEPAVRSSLGARPQRTRPQPPGHQAALPRSRMSPELSYGRHAGPAPHTARSAAVVLLLFRRAGRWHLPLTERPLTLAHHAGQISLPGGAVDHGESSIEAARRELKEELGFDAPHLRCRPTCRLLCFRQRLPGDALGPRKF